jgi:TetR/AcrR family transcriptional repressor of nem operon
MGLAMARPREFDPDAALERAMQAFWVKGYEATSLDDLCAATGLSRSSLYATFGDKHALLLQALDRYEESSAARIEAALDRSLPIREAMAALLTDFIDSIVAGPGRRGCFIGNCAAELARHDRDALARVRRSLERTERQFREALERAKARGELAPSADPRALARFLASGIHGLRLVGKANPDRETLDDVARTMLRCLG